MIGSDRQIQKHFRRDAAIIEFQIRQVRLQRFNRVHHTETGTRVSSILLITHTIQHGARNLFDYKVRLRVTFLHGGRHKKESEFG